MKKSNYGLIFWDKLHDDTYFNDDKGIIQIKCVKLTNNMYQIKIPWCDKHTNTNNIYNN